MCAHAFCLCPALNRLIKLMVRIVLCARVCADFSRYSRVIGPPASGVTRTPTTALNRRTRRHKNGAGGPRRPTGSNECIRVSIKFANNIRGGILCACVCVVRSNWIIY